MPYSEISSPSQIANMVPAVMASRIVMDGSQRLPLKPNGTMTWFSAWTDSELKMLICPMADQGRHGNGKEVSPALHPLATFTRILLHAALESRNNRDQQLQNDLGGNVRIHAHREQREGRDGAAGQQIEEAQETGRSAARWHGRL